MRLNNKKALLTKNVLRILISVIAITLLVYLSVQLYSIFTTRTNLAKARSTLSRIIVKAESLENKGDKETIIAGSPNEWYFFSTEFGDRLCASDFCLCLCKDKECEKEYVCKPTKRFFVLRGLKNKEMVFFEQSTPLELEIKYSYKDEVFPYRAGDIVEKKFLGIKGITPLLYRFNSSNNWEWSPDLKNWMSISKTKVVGGQWDGDSPEKKNKDFIESLQKKCNEGVCGENLLKDLDIKKSKGVVTLRVTENAE